MTEQLAFAAVETSPCPARVSLLGSFRLEVAGRAVALSAGAQRLIALLCLRERMTRRQLSGNLWPETTTAQALTNLRHALWKLQGAVTGVPVVVDTGGELELGPGVASDIELLRSALEAAGEDADAGLLSPERLRELTRVEAAELLADWDEEWLCDDRERFRQLRLHVLERWALRLARDGEHGLALEAALAALRTDPLRESAHRTVIRIHLVEGNVGEARRAFASCRSLLRTEVGIDPSPQTAALLS